MDHVTDSYQLRHCKVFIVVDLLTMHLRVCIAFLDINGIGPRALHLEMGRTGYATLRIHIAIPCAMM